ncbi:hypothetical protein L596_029777 [Steinernema carpocapsae]|uniref:Thioredoxin domain-containing protein n=1 Tax=Steinernema carpocapsae TaxID=34508 RepID=A0A4U5LQT1_STECR|nr:hypothetical protein L596_029777 [Steinernema carpocapsae]
MHLNEQFPDFAAQGTEGVFKCYDFMGASWMILFSHPNDFTPVCTTELARAVELNAEFKKRNTKLVALSCNSNDSHDKWIPDILAYGKRAVRDKGGDESSIPDKFPFPIIADESRALAHQLEMLDQAEKDSQNVPMTARAVFFVSPDHKLKAQIVYPATTGRNFDEILRVLDSLQLTYTKQVATPVDWQMGDQCMVPPTSMKSRPSISSATAWRPSKCPPGRPTFARRSLRTTRTYFELCIIAMMTPVCN